MLEGTPSGFGGLERMIEWSVPGETLDRIMTEKPDPTKDPEFQKVIRHFVTTPHKPHEPIGKKKKDAPTGREKTPKSGSV
jgi:hypothetical protein